MTSTDSGLAVPDWPLSYGSFFPPMVGGIRFEHTHRVIASLVGLLTLVLTVWIGKTEKRRSVRWLAIACLGAVVLQGILGGLTVLHKLPAPVSIAHAGLGPVFFCLTVALAMLTSPQRNGPPPFSSPREAGGGEEGGRSVPPSQPLSIIFTSAAFLQLLLGAIVRHTHEGVAFHVTLAFLVLIIAGIVVRRAVHLKPVLFLGFLVVLEFFLGIGTFVFTRMTEAGQHSWARILFPTFHQTFGALILATGVFLVLSPDSER